MCKPLPRCLFNPVHWKKMNAKQLEFAGDPGNERPPRTKESILSVLVLCILVTVWELLPWHSSVDIWSPQLSCSFKDTRGLETGRICMHCIRLCPVVFLNLMLKGFFFYFFLWGLTWVSFFLPPSLILHQISSPIHIFDCPEKPAHSVRTMSACVISWQVSLGFHSRSIRWFRLGSAKTRNTSEGIQTLCGAFGKAAAKKSKGMVLCSFAFHWKVSCTIIHSSVWVCIF